MVLAIIAFSGLAAILGIVYGYGWGYRNGLKKLPDDITSVMRKQADEIAKKNIQELKDKMEGKDK